MGANMDPDRFPIEIDTLEGTIATLLWILPTLWVHRRQLDASATLLAAQPARDGRHAPREAMLARLGWSHSDRLVVWKVMAGMGALQAQVGVTTAGSAMSVGRWLFGAAADTGDSVLDELERVAAGDTPLPSSMGSAFYIDGEGRRYIWADEPTPPPPGGSASRAEERDAKFYCYCPYVKDEARLAYAESQHVPLPEVNGVIMLRPFVPERDGGGADVVSLVTMVDAESGGGSAVYSARRTATATVVLRGMFTRN
jgi:hypothetical protein